MKVYEAIARNISGHHKCMKEERACETLSEVTVHEIAKNHLPQGSGWDTKIDIEGSTSEKLIIYVEYTYYSEGGYCMGEMEISFTVTPSFIYGINLRDNWHGKTYGSYKNSLRDYIYDRMYQALDEEV